MNVCYVRCQVMAVSYFSGHHEGLLWYQLWRIRLVPENHCWKPNDFPERVFLWRFL